MSIERLTAPWWALRVALGAAAFLSGLDKFFNLLADWPGYLSPLAAHVLPISGPSFMHLIGIVEMVVGAIILAGYTQLGRYVAAIWLAAIAVNLVTTGRYFDIAVRDVAMAMAASPSHVSLRLAWAPRPAAKTAHRTSSSRQKMTA